MKTPFEKRFEEQLQKISTSVTSMGGIKRQIKYMKESEEPRKDTLLSISAIT
jgi:hypothetical protein